MPANNKSNIYKFTSKANIIHDNKYDYSESIYINQETDITIFCSVCKNTFKQKPKAHLSGCGCPNCARVNHRTTNDEFIKNSKQIHGDSTFNYNECIYTVCKNPVILICNTCQNKFSIVPNKHLSRKQGCSICCKNNMDQLNFEKSEKLFWEQVTIKHGTTYDLSVTKYNGVHKNIEIICKKCGLFSIREDTFRRGSGCYECVYIENKHKENSLIDINNKFENWKRCVKSKLYFSPHYQYAYNYRQNSNLYPNSDGKLSCGLIFIDTIWCLFNGDIPNTKYVTFIDENNNNKYLLQNITLADYKCNECNNVFIGYNKISKYCSIICQNNNRMLKETTKKQTNFKYYILGKLPHIKQREKQKTGQELEYNISNFLDSKVWNYGDCSCNWCGLTDLDFADNNIQNPNKLTIDSTNPPYHNKFNDLVPSCLMCNRMLNDISLKDRHNLINYLTGKNDLDLSNLDYLQYDEKIKKTDKQRNPWNTIKEERNLKTDKEAKSLFIEIYNNQNEKSNILYNYPIFYFKNSIYSCSCDRIIPKNNKNYQLIPIFLNYAKNNLSQDEFIIELEKRNYLNNKNVKVILPDNYLNDSYFINKLKNNKTRLGKIRNNNIKVTAYYNNSSKQFISLKECAEYFTTCPKTIKNNIHGKTDNYKHKELGTIIFKLSNF